MSRLGPGWAVEPRGKKKMSSDPLHLTQVSTFSNRDKKQVFLKYIGFTA